MVGEDADEVDLAYVYRCREDAIENLGRPMPSTMTPGQRSLRLLTDPRDRKIVALANMLLDHLRYCKL